MTLLFCNLEEGPPKILRLHGTAEFAELVIKENVDKSLLEKFPDSLTQSPGFRSIFVLTVERISSSCGYSLPVMTYQKTRTTLDEFVQRKGMEGMKEYWIYNNVFRLMGYHQWPSYEIQTLRLTLNQKMDIFTEKRRQ
jgi:hypothetical protein